MKTASNRLARPTKRQRRSLARIARGHSVHWTVIAQLAKRALLTTLPSGRVAPATERGPHLTCRAERRKFANAARAVLDATLAAAAT